jgi:DNA repair exonuclease SbcCD ATPase subunit
MYLPIQSFMDDARLDELREELARLEAAEAHVSAERRRLHQQIDFGYATETARAREREISDERRELHRKIDALRELLPLASAGAPAEVSSTPAHDDLPLDAG